MFRKFLLTAAVAVVAGLMAPSAARAAFSLGLADGNAGDTVIVSLTTTNTYSGSNAGGNYYLSVTVGHTGTTVTGYYDSSTAPLGTGVGKGIYITSVFSQTNQPGAQSGATLNMNSTNVTNEGTKKFGSLLIAISADSYTLPTPQKVLTSTISGNFGAGTGLVTEAAYYDPSNTLFGSGAGTTSVSVSNSTAGSPILGTSPSAPILTTGSPFSMTNGLLLTNLSAGGFYSTTEDSTVLAPAPSGFILAATMVPFFGLLRRRLRQTVAPVAA